MDHKADELDISFIDFHWGQGGAVVAHSCPTSEVGASTQHPMCEIWFTVQNLDQLYVQVSPGHKATHTLTYRVCSESDVKSQINKI